MNFKTPRASPWLKVAIAWTLLSLLLVLSLSHEACASRDATPLGGDGSDPAGDGEITERRVVLRPGTWKIRARVDRPAYLVYHFSLGANWTTADADDVFRYPNCSRAASRACLAPSEAATVSVTTASGATPAAYPLPRDYGRALRELNSPRRAIGARERFAAAARVEVRHDGLRPGFRPEFYTDAPAAVARPHRPLPPPARVGARIELDELRVAVRPRSRAPRYSGQRAEDPIKAYPVGRRRYARSLAQMRERVGRALEQLDRGVSVVHAQTDELGPSCADRIDSGNAKCVCVRQTNAGGA
ncbi:hypothetical protein Q5P01_000686 [Channa striata]|uniref:Uncharacterized protein n=1 Tax=Channa striata TaxID=64152 RepID=A0AA88LFQ5_CHASR|nr:hypothetical protein Q5P01_000686 [Channa striata]